MVGELGGDPSQLRISDADRHRVAEILREAAGEGRLELAELDERLEATYAARTRADLLPILHDLPGHGLTPQPASERHVAIFGGFDRAGAWVVPAELTVLTVLGGVELDLREARFAAREVTITLHCFLGGAQVIVPPHVHVVMEGTGIMGGYAGPGRRVPAEPDDGSPTVRIRGVTVWGGVSVGRKR